MKNPPAPGPEAVRWAYRLFLDREPEDDALLERGLPNTAALRQTFLFSEEFRDKNRDLVFKFPTWVIKETKYGFRLWVSLEELAISRNILMDRYEESEARFMIGTVRPGDHVIDAGANIGFFTMLLAQLASPGGSVRAFEPLGYLHVALGRSVAENRFDLMVETHRLALAESEGTALFRHAPKTANFGGGHLSAGGEIPMAHADEAVELRRLDSFIDDRRVSFIKMDVEGAEPRLIMGAEAMLARDRPVILSEIHNSQLRAVSGVSGNEFMAQMGKLGYSGYAIENGIRGAAVSAYEGDAPINVIFEPNRH